MGQRNEQPKQAFGHEDETDIWVWSGILQILFLGDKPKLEVKCRLKSESR